MELYTNDPTPDESTVLHILRRAITRTWLLSRNANPVTIERRLRDELSQLASEHEIHIPIGGIPSDVLMDYYNETTNTMETVLSAHFTSKDD